MKKEDKYNLEEMDWSTSWSVLDFEKAKSWAIQQHVDDKDLTLWDTVYSPRKHSEDILREIENIKNESRAYRIYRNKKSKRTSH